ncbi:hypothetical protein BX600DRAFT_508482 [Xylariales sp. PMI_506]|nr:hypothetical protein BX600DRAFT_508482 [Xylariales sp. PMI_506]
MDEELEQQVSEQFKAAIEEYITPREEVIMVRRLMALELGQSLGGERHIKHPLSLTDLDIQIPDQHGLKGLHREYLEAVKRNIAIRKEFVKAEEEHKQLVASLREKDTDPDTRILDLHVEVMRLQKDYDKQKVVRKYLDQLQKLPAAAPDFLDPVVMYQNCSPLPEIPKQMVDGFATDHSGTDAEVDELLRNLQKTVLRGKLLARKQKQQFERAQAQEPIEVSQLAPEAKLYALNAVKHTLISWVETQLTKAGDDSADAENEPTSRALAHDEKDELDARLDDIQDKYQRHIELRKEIMALLAQKNQIKPESVTHTAPQHVGEEILAVRSPPIAFLLTPYLEQLRTFSREQKGLIQERSHISVSLAKQQEEAKLSLDHLVQESQLLSKYPSVKSPTPQSELSFSEATKSAGGGGTGSGRSNTVIAQVEPWIYAADSAKIATLETVAEKVEEGMMSIEDARQALEKVCKLLNVVLPGERSPDEWESITGDRGEGATSTVNEAEKKAGPKEPKTIWSILDGNLGSINE